MEVKICFKFHDVNSINITQKERFKFREMVMDKKQIQFIENINEQGRRIVILNF